MLKKLFNRILFHVKENFAYYGISTSAIFCGFVLAVVCAFSLPEFNVKELALYFEDFFTGFLKSGADSKLIMFSALKINVIIFCTLAVFSLMIVGIPFIVFAGVCIGFAVGFAVTFIFRVYSFSALLLIVTAIIPHLIIVLPCYVALIAYSLKFCFLLRNDRSNIKKAIPSFMFSVIIIFVIAFAGTLMQAYIEPVLIQLIAEYFI
ncbi:MAG: stage II sporulation protein M [Clostridia bacterium]|nr:stage II sporulation protein M [Clostridia bacterium]